MRTLLILSISICLLSRFALNADSSNSKQTKEYFPLSAGSVWEYSGTVSWADDLGSHQKEMMWKMEVLSRSNNGTFNIAIMRGHPSDLCWYVPTRVQSNYLIFWRDNQYYKTNNTSAAECVTLAEDKISLSKQAVADNLFLVTPLTKGLEWGYTGDFQRNDYLYRWHVESAFTVAKTYLDSYNHSTNEIIYAIVYRTNPDHQQVIFTPFVGITGYTYVHHGTKSTVQFDRSSYKRQESQ